MKKLLFILFFIGFSSFGQSIEGSELCTRYGVRNFTSNFEANQALRKILGVINAAQKFVLMPCNNISNAGAITYNGTRYIFYNESFMQSVKLNNWTNMAILAHEVGHHINGHTLKLNNLEQQRKEELEADNFSGFILSKLGASLAQTIELTKIFPQEDDTYSSHPSSSKRIIAYTNGWNKGKDNKSLNKIPEEYDTKLSEKSAEEFYNQGNKKLREKDYSGAITDYNSAIELNPKFEAAYNNRGNAKRGMYEIIEAIKDYSKAILIEPNNIMAYANRGNAKNLIKDYKGAISDLSEVIKLDDSDIPSYYDRGNYRAKINDYIGAIADFDKFIELSPDDGYAYYYRGSLKFERDDFFGACKDWRAGASLGDEDSIKKLNECSNLVEIVDAKIDYKSSVLEKVKKLFETADKKEKRNDFKGAINDYSKAIELTPDYAVLYLRRGLAKSKLDYFDNAIDDFSIAIDINYRYANAYYQRARTKVDLKNYEEALNDFSKAILLKPNNVDFYYYRGELNYYYLKNSKSSLNDFNKSIQLDPSDKYSYYLRGSVKDDLKDYYGAIADYTKAIKLDPDYAIAYSGRGISKENVGDLNGACKDWRKAASLGDSKSAKWVREECN